MYYETKTLLLGASENICNFSIEDFIINKIEIKDIDYNNDSYFNYYGKQYCDTMYPYFKDIAMGKYYIMLEHINYGNKNLDDYLFFNKELEIYNGQPHIYLQGCIDTLKFIKKIQLITGINIFSGHIITYKINDDSTREIEYIYPFRFPSYRVLKETFKFPASKINYEKFLSEIDLELPQKKDKATMSLDLFINSLYQSDIKMEYICLIMSIETLLGDEKSYFNNLSDLCAKFLSNNLTEYKKINKEIGLLYYTRNQLIHKGIWKDDFAPTNTSLLREYARKILLKYIEDIYNNITHEEFILMLKE